MTPKRLSELAEASKAVELAGALSEGLGRPIQHRDDLVSTYYAFLNLVAAELKAPLMVELGSWQGVSAFCMAKGNPAARVVSIDIEPGHLLADTQLPNIEFVKADSLPPTYLPGIGLLFVDTIHDGKRPEEEFWAWRDLLGPEAVVLFDDVTLTQEMRDWWPGFHPAGFEKVEDLPVHGNAGFGALVLTNTGGP